MHSLVRRASFCAYYWHNVQIRKRYLFWLDMALWFSKWNTGWNSALTCLLDRASMCTALIACPLMTTLFVRILAFSVFQSHQPSFIYQFFQQTTQLCLKVFTYTVSSAQNTLSPLISKGTPTQPSYFSSSITSLSPQVRSKEHLRRFPMRMILVLDLQL